jgi:hypothetical protein
MMGKESGKVVSSRFIWDLRYATAASGPETLRKGMNI